MWASTGGSTSTPARGRLGRGARACAGELRPERAENELARAIASLRQMKPWRCALASTLAERSPTWWSSTMVTASVRLAKSLSTPSDLARGVREALHQVRGATPARAVADPRLDRRHQRHHRAQRRPHRAAHHRAASATCTRSDASTGPSRSIRASGSTARSSRARTSSKFPSACSRTAACGCRSTKPRSARWRTILDG